MSAVVPATRGRLLPALALLSCVGGIVALHLPLVRQDLTLPGDVDRWTGVEAAVDGLDVRLAAVPLLGPATVAIFLGLTVLPVVDLCIARPRLTGLLIVPALIGLVPIVPLLGMAVGTAGFGGLLSGMVADGVLRVVPGPGAVLLILAELGLLVLGPWTVATWWRDRAGRAPRYDPPEESPPTAVDHL